MQINNVNRSTDGRKLLLNFEINEFRFTVVNVYSPNNKQNRIVFNLLSFIKTNTRKLKTYYLCWDFNCRLDNVQDKKSHFSKNLIKQCDIFYAWITM